MGFRNYGKGLGLGFTGVVIGIICGSTGFRVLGLGTCHRQLMAFWDPVDGNSFTPLINMVLFRIPWEYATYHLKEIRRGWEGL